MKPEDLLRNNIRTDYISLNYQEGIFLRSRASKDAATSFIFELGWFSKKGKANVILMYAFGEVGFKMANTLRHGDFLGCKYLIDSFVKKSPAGVRYQGVRGIVNEFRIIGRDVNTAQYLDSDFEKSVTNELSSGDEVRDITDKYNY
jgi:hypothetical protein